MRIKIDSTKKVTLYNHEFDEMRNALDVTLQTTLKSMIAKNMTGASIGLKIDITLMKQVLKDDNAPTGTREALRPDINARIVAAMQQRVDKKVGVIGKTSNVELLVDDTGDFFFVTKEEASGQLSMFRWFCTADQAFLTRISVTVSEAASVKLIFIQILIWQRHMLLRHITASPGRWIV